MSFFPPRYFGQSAQLTPNQLVEMAQNIASIRSNTDRINTKFPDETVPAVVVRPAPPQGVIPRVAVGIDAVTWGIPPEGAAFHFRIKETRTVRLRKRFECPKELTVYVGPEGGEAFLYPSEEFTNGGFDGIVIVSSEDANLPPTEITIPNFSCLLVDLMPPVE